MEDNIKMKILSEVKDNINNGDIKKAEVLLKGYLDFNNDPEIASILANIYTGRGDLTEALEILNKVLSVEVCVSPKFCFLITYTFSSCSNDSLYIFSFNCALLFKQKSLLFALYYDKI